MIQRKSDEERENFTDVELAIATNSTSFCLIRLDLIPKLSD
jgi:hypothetical protein